MFTLQQFGSTSYQPILQIPFSANKFVKKIRKGLELDSILLLHENNAISLLKRTNNVEKEQLEFDLLDIVQCQTALYDVLPLQDKLIISCRNLPIRILQQSENKKNEYQVAGSIGTKKKNSELYETPIQFAKHQLQQHNFIGGGKKFAHIYDINKLGVSTSLKKFNKKHISSLNFLTNDNTMLFGQFDGNISLYDFRDPAQPFANMQIHFDAITNIVPHPVSSDLFVTSARKDDFKYLWDRRKLNSFIQKYRQTMYGNQRVGVDIFSNSKNDYLIGGNQFGHVSIWQLQSGILCDTLKFTNSENQQNFQDCIGAIYSDNQNQQLYFGIGGRTFSYKNEKQISKCSLKSLKFKERLNSFSIP